MKMMSYITNKKPSVQITFKEINLSAGLYLLIQKKVTKKICPEKKCDADAVFFPSKCLSVSEKIILRDRRTEIGFLDTYMESTRKRD